MITNKIFEEMVKELLIPNHGIAGFLLIRESEQKFLPVYLKDFQGDLILQHIPGYRIADFFVPEYKFILFDKNFNKSSVETKLEKYFKMTTININNEMIKL